MGGGTSLEVFDGLKAVPYHVNLGIQSGLHECSYQQRRFVFVIFRHQDRCGFHIASQNNGREP